MSTSPFSAARRSGGITFPIDGVGCRAALQQRLDHGDVARDHRDHEERLARRIGLVGILALEQQLADLLLVALAYCLGDGLQREQVLGDGGHRQDKEREDGAADHLRGRVSW
jgi:hypothetical protein